MPNSKFKFKFKSKSKSKSKVCDKQRNSFSDIPSCDEIASLAPYIPTSAPPLPPRAELLWYNMSARTGHEKAV